MHDEVGGCSGGGTQPREEGAEIYSWNLQALTQHERAIKNERNQRTTKQSGERSEQTGNRKRKRPVDVIAETRKSDTPSRCGSNVQLDIKART